MHPPATRCTYQRLANLSVATLNSVYLPFSRQGVIWIASQKTGEVKEWASGTEARGKPLMTPLGLLRCEEESPLLL